MNQISFSDAEYAGKRKKTRREVFLEEMELVVPWKVLLKIISPHYPVAGRGRRPYPLESMLRVHLMQNWFALSDPAMEEALYEIASLRSFARLSLNEPIPDETTILNFRHLLEAICRHFSGLYRSTNSIDQICAQRTSGTCGYRDGPAKGTLSRPDISEADAIQTLQSIDQVWDNLYPAEQACIAKALIERITVRTDGINIKWKSTGMTKLLRDTVMQQAYREAA